ncbi:ThiF family adenylyltransferase [Cribrihabitans pelagius]|uniref:ThiF family adenylyltransferase n=1 Tax=Cribrihabitans pelagius TaxID=1765746 RepID=UPI003B5AB7DE
MSRYARQMALPEVGPEGQARLARAHVLVAGAGGLGCPVLQYLAGAGIGEITVMDPDVVEESNLHRQPLYTMEDVGQYKAEAARRRLLAANPGVRLHPHARALDAANAGQAVRHADLVVDAADSFAVSYILSDECFAQGKPLISASVLGQSGYAGGFCGGAPSLRAVFPDLPAQAATCASAGVMGPAVGMIGALQAQMALQVLLGQMPSPLGQMFTLRLGSLELGGFRFDEATEPARPLPFTAAALLTPEDLAVELRDTVEAPLPAVPGALRLPREALSTAALPRDRRIVLCCHSGLRAWGAAAELRAAGYDSLALLAAGAGA